MRRSDDFEPQLLARITHPGRVGRPRRRRRIGGWWWQIPVVALVAALLAGAWWLFPRGHEAALATLAKETIAGLQAGGPAAFVQHTGASLTVAERERLHTHYGHLVHILEDEGISLETANPIAFGGARARVSAPGGPNPGVWASVGNLYLDAGGKLVAIEYGARREDRAYRLTDIWTAEVLGPASLSAAESHARAAYRAFLEQDNEPGVEARLRSTRFVFFSLN
jgi:hypothetical protein